MTWIIVMKTQDENRLSSLRLAKSRQNPGSHQNKKNKKIKK